MTSAPNQQSADPDLAPLGVKLDMLQPWRWCFNRHPLVILAIFSLAFPGVWQWASMPSRDFWVFDVLDAVVALRFALSASILAIMLRKDYDVPADLFPIISDRTRRIACILIIVGLGFSVGHLPSHPALWVAGAISLVFMGYAFSFLLLAVAWMFYRHRAHEALAMWFYSAIVVLVNLSPGLMNLLS